jgi:hypothetical protein
MATPPYVIQAFHDAVKSVAPHLDGVAMDNINDRSTWFIHFFDGATDDEIKAAQNVQATFDPFSVKPPLPSLTKRQILVWLILNLKKTDQDILNALNTITDPVQKEIATINWLYADGPIERDNPFINQFGPLFNLTPDQIDQAFIDAQKL